MLHLLWLLCAFAGGPPASSSIEDALARAEAAWDQAVIGSVQELEAIYEEAFDAASDPASTARVRLALGEACFRHGLSQPALYELEQGLAGFRAGVVGRHGVSAEEGRALLNAGVKSFAARKAVAADLYWVQGVSDGTVELALLIGVGNLYLSQEQRQEAERHYLDARGKADAAGHGAIRAGVRVNLAWAAVGDGNHQGAIEHLDAIEQLGLLADPAHRVGLRGAYLAEGAALVRAGKHKRAVRLLREARPLYREAGDEEGLGALIVTRAQALEALGDHARALQAYTAAADLGSTRGDVTWAAPLGVARLKARGGDARGALEAYAAYLDALEARAATFGTDEGRFSIVEAHAEHLDAMVALAVAHAQATGDSALAHRAAARARRRSLPALVATRSIEDRPPGVLPAARLGAGHESHEAPWATEGGHEPSMAMQMALSTSLEPAWFGGEPVTSDLGAIERSGALFAMPEAPSGVTVLSYTLLRDRTVITVREPGGAVHLAIGPLGASALADRATALRLAMGASPDKSRGLEEVGAPAGVASGADRLREELGNALLAPVRAHLPGAEDPLLVVPDGVLWTVPFAALPEAGGALFGARVFSLGVSEGSVATSASRPRPEARRALVVGHPGQGRVEGCGRDLRFPALAAATGEARTIAGLSGWAASDLLAGDQPDALRLDAWHRAYDVLHFATHGVACGGDPLESFLLLATPGPGVWARTGAGTVTRTDDDRLPVRADRGTLGPAGPMPSGWRPAPRPEVLTARQVLEHWSLNADLVTLSACETGLGQASSEGTIGMMRAFLAAGARSVLVSLWEVDDDATRMLMERFYAGYLAHRDKGRALRDAMAHVRRRHPDPRLWSAFALVGPTR